MRRKTSDVRAIPACYRLNFTCCYLPALSTQSCISWLPFCIFCCQSRRCLRNVSLGRPHILFLGLIKKSFDDWLSMTSEHPKSRLDKRKSLKRPDSEGHILHRGLMRCRGVQPCGTFCPQICSTSLWIRSMEKNLVILDLKILDQWFEPVVFNSGGVATSPVVLRWMCDSPRTGCAWRITPLYM